MYKITRLKFSSNTLVIKENSKMHALSTCVGNSKNNYYTESFNQINFMQRNSKGLEKFQNNLANYHFSVEEYPFCSNSI